MRGNARLFRKFVGVLTRDAQILCTEGAVCPSGTTGQRIQVPCLLSISWGGLVCGRRHRGHARAARVHCRRHPTRGGRVGARDRQGQSRGSPVCSCRSHDTAPTGITQVGGAPGFPAAQSGPPAPGGTHGTGGKSSLTQPRSSPTPPSQSVTATYSQALTRTNVHASSWSCPCATGAWGSNAYPQPRVPPRSCPQPPLPKWY